MVDTLSKILAQLIGMDSEKQLHSLKELLRDYFSKFQLSVPDDFLELTVEAMKMLEGATSYMI